VTDGDTAATHALVTAAKARGVPLKLLVPGDERLRARYGARFALIRPDQHVGWRGDAIPEDCDGLLARLTGADGAPSLVIARSQRVRPEVAGPMTGSATKQSSSAAQT
jgi:hypothetical protein